LRSLEGHSGWIYCINFPDEHWLASGGEDGTIIIWDPTTGAKRFVLEGHTGRVSAVAFTADGHRLASIGFFDKSVKIWDMGRGQELLSLNSQSNGHAVAFSHNGHLLASAGANRTVCIWNGTPLP
jgi:WD40 repeat protein